MRTKRNILLIDLEATCWESEFDRPIAPDGIQYVNEIIEIGAVLLEGGSLKELDEFQVFVKPQQNTVLTDFCKKLTHITQSNVDNAANFQKVYREFIDYFNLQGRSEPVFASWGNYDRNQITSDCSRHALLYPFRKENHLNIKTHVAKLMNVAPRSVGKMLSFLGMEFDGVQHRALDDTKNIARIMREVKSRADSQMMRF